MRVGSPDILNLSCRHDPTSSFLEIGFQAFDGDGIPEGIVLHHANWIAQISKLIKFIWKCQSDQILIAASKIRNYAADSGNELAMITVIEVTKMVSIVFRCFLRLSKSRDPKQELMHQTRAKLSNVYIWVSSAKG